MVHRATHAHGGRHVKIIAGAMPPSWPIFLPNKYKQKFYHYLFNITLNIYYCNHLRHEANFHSEEANIHKVLNALRQSSNINDDLFPERHLKVP